MRCRHFGTSTRLASDAAAHPAAPRVAAHTVTLRSVAAHTITLGAAAAHGVTLRTVATHAATLGTAAAHGVTLGAVAAHAATHNRTLGAIARPVPTTARPVDMTITITSADEAVADIKDGSTILIGGFGTAGQPMELIDAVRRAGPTGLTIVNNNAGNGDEGLAALLAAGQVDKIICSFPRQKDSYVFDELYRSGRIDLEVVPQGNLAERIRAAGAGIGAFYSPTGVGTLLADGKEIRTFDGREYALEFPIRADVALIKAHRADRLGNLVYRKTARNFGPIMAAAATTTIVQVASIVEIGDLDPESVVTPSIYVNRVVEIPSARVPSAEEDGQ